MEKVTPNQILELIRILPDADEDLHEFLINIKYKLDDTDGRCLLPVQLIS